jgi:hypothetical protein
MVACRSSQSPGNRSAESDAGEGRATVENGAPPDAIRASRVENGKVTRTRPLCPYPQVAIYSGSGSTDDAANFACRTAR